MLKVLEKVGFIRLPSEDFDEVSLTLSLTEPETVDTDTQEDNKE
jgi:hypothetical protein